VVSVAVPLDREDVVGRVVAIANRFFTEREGARRSPRIVLSGQAVGAPAPRWLRPAPVRPLAGRLTHAGAR
jgi:hypothetical protein